MRARYPDSAGFVDRDGVRIHYEAFGDSETSLLLIPPSPISHSRIWKAQIPYLARHFRVLTLDGRGNGKSGRPSDVEAYHRDASVADILAVLDATDTADAVLVAHCHANWWAVELASAYPQRVRALVAIEPGVPHLGRRQRHWVDASAAWEEIPSKPSGWALYNRHTITNHHRQWVEFFFAAQLVERHSTKQHEDAVGWALESTGEILAAAEEAEDLDPPDRDTFEAMCRHLDIPMLVIHGTEDVCQHVTRGRELAQITDGELVEVEGGGHLTLVRDPVRVNRAIKDFVERVAAA